MIIKTQWADNADNVDSASIDYETGEKNRNKAHEIKDRRSETEIKKAT